MIVEHQHLSEVEKHSELQKQSLRKTRNFLFKDVLELRLKISGLNASLTFLTSVMLAFQFMIFSLKEEL